MKSSTSPLNCITVEMMGGEISLDTSYSSRIDGCPGARFVIKIPTIPLNHGGLDSGEESTACESLSNADSEDVVLPEELNVLLVDDDHILRKMMIRSLKRLAPRWKVREASSGETALSIVQDSQFDLIFLDQYMASAEKQLLGTETASAMRCRNVTSRICGLSANDMRDTFLSCGADYFILKPFSTNMDTLRLDLRRALGLVDT